MLPEILPTHAIEDEINTKIGHKKLLGNILPYYEGIRRILGCNMGDNINSKYHRRASLREALTELFRKYITLPIGKISPLTHSWADSIAQKHWKQ